MLDPSDDLNVGDKITSMVDATTSCFATVRRIATAYECWSLVATLRPPDNPDEPSFVWSGTVHRGRLEDKNGWDRFGTEGYKWCRGWEGPPVNRLLVARGLVGR